MPRKRILREFRIDEISGVDNPAQEGARVMIMKRAPFQGQQIVEKSHTIEQEVKDSATRTLISEKSSIKRENNMEKIESNEQKNETGPIVEELQKQLETANTVIALKSEERTHFDSLDENAQKTFLAKSADARISEIEAKARQAQDADPVVYTTIDGVEIRKSTGEAFIAMAKSNDIIRQENAALREQREQDALEKRAETELSHVPGDLSVRAAILKAIDGIADSEKKDAAMNSLKAQNEAMAKAFETHGHAGQPEPGSAEDQLDRLAQDHAKEKGMSEATAYVEVLKSTEGKKLYAQTVN